MCGILGFYTHLAHEDLTDRLKKGLHHLHRRGPDASLQRIYSLHSGALGLAHARLSILDLSDAGLQPMESADGRYSLVFNGEIYNYLELKQEFQSQGVEFHTKTDTEVLLHLLMTEGVEGLQKLDGMFALAFLDRSEERLLLIRDAFGIKPLYWFFENGQLGFASEIPALLALRPGPNRLNMHAAYRFLTFGEYDDSAQTFFEGIHSLKPGQYIDFRFQNSIFQPRIWWQPDSTLRFQGSFDEAADQFRHLFLQSVRRQLRSDVQLGAALSGGLDSSALVCAMRHLEPEMPLRTFSYTAKGSQWNEEHWADQVCAQTLASAYRTEADPHEMLQDLPDLIRTQAEPFGSTSIYAQYRVYQLARENDVTVTLDGQGADEILAGYSGFPGYRLHSLFEQGHWGQALQFYSHWKSGVGRSSMEPLRTLGRLALPRSFHPTPSPAWLNMEYFKNHGVELAKPEPTLRFSQRGRRLIGREASALHGYGLPALLRHGDRNSMRFSVESRVPFLSPSLVEFCLGLPEEYLISQKGVSKALLRQALRGIVPEAVLDRKDKIGFATPGRPWFLKLRPFIEKALNHDLDLPCFRRDELRQEFAGLQSSQKPFDWKYWRILNFILWVQEFDIELEAAT